MNPRCLNNHVRWLWELCLRQGQRQRQPCHYRQNMHMSKMKCASTYIQSIFHSCIVIIMSLFLFSHFIFISSEMHHSVAIKSIHFIVTSIDCTHIAFINCTFSHLNCSCLSVCVCCNPFNWNNDWNTQKSSRRPKKKHGEYQFMIK